MNTTPPDLTAFLTAPEESVVAAAPASAVFAGGGTRRAAALADIAMGHDYARWSQAHMFDACALFFRLGVRHLFIPLVRPTNMAETGVFREHMGEWLQWGLTGLEAQAIFQAHPWRVRLIFAGDPPPYIRAIQHQLDEWTGAAEGPRLFFTVTTSVAELWEWHRRMFLQGVATLDAAIRFLYGEDVSPVRLCVSFGKPIVGPDLLPPLLSDEVQCYWRQRPGYNITDAQLRRVLFDYAYARPTWQADKTGRADQVRSDRAAWEQGPTLGLGIRRGQFWYPEAWHGPPDDVSA
jgi:hypothetical protein